LEPLTGFLNAIEGNGILKPYFFQSQLDSEQIRTQIENIARDLHSLLNRLDAENVTRSDVSRLVESYRRLHITHKAHGELLRLFAEAWLKQNVTEEESSSILHSLVAVLNDILFDYDDTGTAYIAGTQSEYSLSEVKDNGVGLLRRYEQAFESVDPDGTGLVTLDDFKKSLNIVMEQVSAPERSEAEIDEIFVYFQKPGSDMMQYSLFLQQLSGHAEEVKSSNTDLTYTKLSYKESSDTQELEPESVNRGELMVDTALHRWPTSRMLMPSVVEQYDHQEEELRQKEEELNIAHNVASAMEQNISRLEVEKQGLVQEAHMLRIQLEEMYAESERQKEKASMHTDRVRKEVQSEKEQYHKYINERETELLRIVNLWTETRDTLEQERRTHSNHLNRYKKEMEAKSAKEKEIRELQERLRKVEETKTNRKDALLELEKVKHTLALQTERRKAVEAENQKLLEEVERLAHSHVEQQAIASMKEPESNQHDVGAPIPSYGEIRFATSRNLHHDLESEVRGRNLIRFRTFRTNEESESHWSYNHHSQRNLSIGDRARLEAKSILDVIIEKVCRNTPRVLYHHTIRTVGSLGFIIWKDEMNKNAMVVKTSHETAKQGVKVGSWICTINGRYVYGLPFECILLFLRAAGRPLKIGFMDDSSTDSLNYIDNLETQNMLNNREIKRLHSKYEHSSSINEDVTPQARLKRMEKNENCMIQ